MENIKLEQNEKERFKILENIFGENFTREKTFQIFKDVDQDNKEKELIDKKVFWTEFKNPDTNEVVEAKIYLPESGEKIKKVLIVSPGYRGDFVLQEADYADDFVKDDRAMIMTQHNGLRINGEDMQNCIHCPEKANFAEQKDQEYIGKNKDFDFLEADKEVLTVLKLLGDKIDDIEKIDIIGHSWGGRIVLNSIVELKKQVKDFGAKGEIAKKIISKIDNLVLMGAWLETRKEIAENYREFFKDEENGDYFKNLNGDKIVEQMIISGNKLKKLKSSDLPENMRIVGIHSVEDQDIDLEGEILEFFKQIKDIKRKGHIVLKDLKELMPDKIGDRETENHDYALKQAREWIKLVIDKN
ncbi:hypothetical protein KAS41_03145 [Candidatus Parcubacteria bacterium]|nr:hypothetical protein [Candidatus Parcubacteria bacterium]